MRSLSSPRRGLAPLAVAYYVAVYLFLMSTIFDPADKVFGLKVPLYVLCWVTGLMMCVSRNGSVGISRGLLVYMGFMILIPIVSIASYYMAGGGDPFEGFVMLKAYLFISFAALIYITKLDLIKHLSRVLVILAICIFFLTAVVLIYPELHMPIYLVGERLGVFSIDTGRDYGSDVVLFQMYFSTSPMIAIAIAYYFHAAVVFDHARWKYATLVTLLVFAMMVAGSRNNILAAFFLPLCLFFLYSPQKIKASVLATFIFCIVLMIWRNEIGALFDPDETSNSSKLKLVDDYATLFGDPVRLLFGGGLGAYDQWSEKGFNFITELTYFEVMRNFGLLLGGLLMALLLFPLFYAFVLRRSYGGKHIIVAYLAYLVMSASNPLMFSSMGMMLLGVIMADIAMYEATGVGIERIPATRSAEVLAVS